MIWGLNRIRNVLPIISSILPRLWRWTPSSPSTSWLKFFWMPSLAIWNMGADPYSELLLLVFSNIIVIWWKMCWDYKVFWKLVDKPFVDNKWDLQPSWNSLSKSYFIQFRSEVHLTRTGSWTLAFYWSGLLKMLGCLQNSLF